SGNTTKFEYDEAGRLGKVTDALGNSTSYEYDDFGNMISQTDANGNKTTFEYDNFGRKIKRTLPLGMSETYTYDAVGNIVAMTDFNGNTTKFEYDVNDRLTKKIYPDGSEETYTYTVSGKRETVTDSRGTTTFKYDVMGRLIKETGPDGISIEYTYDAAGNRTTVKVPSGTTTYTYDKLGRLSAVTDPDGGVTTYTYDEVGNRTGVSYPNGTKTVYTYDKLNRLVRLVNQGADGEIISSYEYTLDPSGNRIKIEENSGRVIEYEYDNTYKLLKEAIKNPDQSTREISYTYDAVGNRLTKTDGEYTVNYSYDKNNRLISEGENIYTYDNNGNTTSKKNTKETISYTYGYNNRLISVVTTNQEGTSTVEYIYDTDGIRVGKIVDGTKVSRYTVDKNTDYAKVLEERDENGALVVSYVHGDDLISQKRGNVKSYYQYDGLGSTRALTDNSGEITDTYTYDAFGNLIEKTGNTENEFLYTGEQYDANIGFYYLRARYLDPTIGRFVTMDSFEGIVKDPYSLHKYLYAHANPVMNTDPSGLFTLGQQVAVLAISTILANSLITCISLFNTVRGVGDDAPIDGFIVNARGGAFLRGFTVGGGLDIIIDIVNSDILVSFALEGGTDPLSLFKNHRKGGLGITAGPIFNMSNPQQMADFGFSAAWPLSVLHLIGRIMTFRGSTWGLMTQFAKNAKNNRGWTAVFGQSTSGPAYFAIGPSSRSFSSLIGWDSQYVSLKELSPQIGNEMYNWINDISHSIGKWTSFKDLCESADSFMSIISSYSM
ncbi:MAG TPA: RHS repeat-associated core domain-containing protein, partial [Acetivibrio sp.]|nr:RHS repeat-associated core domain-containing protein [Acetivibrio sp.]